LDLFLTLRLRVDEVPTRFNSSHSLFEQLAAIVKEPSNNLRRWFPAAEQAVNTIYTLSEQPDRVCASIIKHLTQQLRAANQSDSAEASCSTAALTRLIFIVGHVALRHLVHLDYIQGELRRRRSVKEKLNEDKKGKPGHVAEAIEDELGVQTATEESEGEFIQQVAERQLVCRNLLGAYAPLVISICQNANNKFEV
jgi:condensin complex subunit 1